MDNTTRPLTLSKALEISAQDQPGAIDSAVTRLRTKELVRIWNRVRAQPRTYMLTNEEFAVVDYYRDFFSVDESMQLAIQRFWEHCSPGLIDKQKPKESEDRHVKTPKTEFLQECNNTITPSDPQFISELATRFSSRNNTTQYGSKASTAADKVACKRCRDRRMRCDGERPSCGICRRFNFGACFYPVGTGDYRPRPSLPNTRMLLSKESSVTPTSSDQDSVQFHNLSPSKGSDRMDKHDAAEACERCGQRRTECNGEHPESPENLSQEPHEKIDISYRAYGERNTISRDGQADKEDEPTLQTWEASPENLKSQKSLSLDLSHFRVRVLNGREYSLANSMKLWIQFLTGESWDWWPLRPCFQQLLDDELRIHWYCVSHYPYCLAPGLLTTWKDSGHAHWTVFSKNDLVLSLEALKSQAAMRSVPSERKNPQSSSKSRSSTTSSRSSGSETSSGDSSPATSEGGSSDQPDDDADSGKNTEPSGTSTAIDIIPPGNLIGFVLFGVHGSKRLQNANLRLAQIDVAVYRDDDSFFDEMIVQYRKLRGCLRRFFSIWVFYTCEFIMV